jgi:hypothetical protein
VAGVVVSLRQHCPVVELSALIENELPGVEGMSAIVRSLGFHRVSVHGPASGRALPETELVGRLGELDREVVMHPDTLEVWSRWDALGSRLLVENMDSRKKMGQEPADLDRVFAALPSAQLCLDVSHALDVGGIDLAVRLATRYQNRVAQLHAGCGCGRHCTPILEQQVIDGVLAVWEVVGRSVPLILERKVPAADTEAQRAQLTAFSPG